MRRSRTTHAAPSYYTEAPWYYSVLSYFLHLFFQNTTLFPAAKPRLPLITPPKRSSTTPKRQSTTLPRSTQPQLRRLSITLSRLTTQKLLFPTTLNRRTTLMLQFTTSRPTLHRSPQVLHWRSRLLHNNVCCLVYYTEAFKHYITKAPEFYTSVCVLPLPTTPTPRITATLKRSSTALQPTLPRATTLTSRSITVRKRSRLKKKEVVPEL
jgi:hypothetical protein